MVKNDEKADKIANVKSGTKADVKADKKMADMAKSGKKVSLKTAVKIHKKSK